MGASHKLPGYNVEFLPLERRLLDRREGGHPVAWMMPEQRRVERRLPGGETSARATPLQAIK